MPESVAAPKARTWSCIVCYPTAKPHLVTVEPKNEAPPPFGYCKEHAPVGNKAACFCGRPDVETFMELVAPDDGRSLYSICEFHNWMWQHANDQFEYEFKIMVKPGFKPEQWPIRAEWWLCDHSGCRRITRVLPKKREEEGLVRGWCKKHKPRVKPDLAAGVLEAVDGEMYTLVRGRKIPCQVVKDNHSKPWVKLPNGVIIQRKRSQIFNR